MSIEILEGDWIDRLCELPSESVQMCVTSPPYWGLRDYKHPDQIGREPTPQEYVDNLVAGFSHVWRALKKDGTLWLNLGDCYAGGGNGGGGSFSGMRDWDNKNVPERRGGLRNPKRFKPKDLVGIPWMVAFALRDDGWYLRSDIIWHKPNPMPESVTDRPTRAHEYIFLFSKSRKYFYDHEAIKNPPSPDLIKQVEDGYNGNATKEFDFNGVQDASATKSRIILNARNKIEKQRGHNRRHNGFNDRWDKLTKTEQQMLGSNKRSVWTVAPSNYREAHFATFPPDLIRPCILAGSRVGDTVIDPFFGSGTTGEVCLSESRICIGIELNPEYIDLAKNRCGLTNGVVK